MPSSVSTSIPSCTVGQFAAYLKDFIEMYLESVEEGTPFPFSAIVAHGASGIGKTSVAKAVAKSMGIQDVRILTACTVDPQDMSGLPHIKDGETFVYLPLEDICPTDPESTGILILDEVTSADYARQQAIMKLVLDRTMGYKVLPPKWVIVALGNTERDGAYISGLLGPLCNRLMHIEVHYNSAEHIERCIREGYEPILVEFLGAYRTEGHNYVEGATAWPSPRSWEVADRLLKRGKKKHPDADLLEIIEGKKLGQLPLASAIGVGTVAQLTTFLERRKTLPDVNLIIDGQSEGLDMPMDDASTWSLTMQMLYRLEERFPEDRIYGHGSEEAVQVIEACFNCLSWLYHRRNGSEACQLLSSQLCSRAGNNPTLSFGYKRGITGRLIGRLQEGNLDRLVDTCEAETRAALERSYGSN